VSIDEITFLTIEGNRFRSNGKLTIAAPQKLSYRLQMANLPFHVDRSWCAWDTPVPNQTNEETKVQTSSSIDAPATPAPELKPLKGDLLKGVKQISSFLDLSERQTFHLCSTGQLSSAFKLGRLWYARKSTLLEELRRREQGGT
jgi:hypothetical protein